MGHEHEDQVVDDETGAEPAGGMGAAGQFGDRPYGPSAVGGRRSAVGGRR